VITNRLGFAVHIVAGLPASRHDFGLFCDYLTSVEELVGPHRGERCGILADKGYVGTLASTTVKLTTPYKTPRGEYLSPEERHAIRLLSSERVVIENYFGKLSVKFQLMARR
jgi:hypothetical protein